MKEKPSQALHEREYYLSRVMTKEYMEERWKKINYTPPKDFKIEQQLRLIL